MSSKARTLIQVLLIAFVTHANAANSPPNPNFTRTATLEKENETQSSAKLEYKSNKIEIVATASANTLSNSFTFAGTYITSQPLESGVNLAYQIYSIQGDVLVHEGMRSEFESTEKGKKSSFDHSYKTDKLNLPKEHDEFYIKFNYVKEGEYWADDKFPDWEFPAFKIKNLNRGEQFETAFSYFPTFILKDSTTYSFHYYNSQKSYTQPYFHRATVEALYQNEGFRDNNQRYLIDSTSSKEEQTHSQIAAFKLATNGEVLLRLGYVWDKVQWYNLPTSDFTKAYVINAPLYFSLASLAVLLIIIAFWTSRIWKRRLWKIASQTTGSILVGIYVLEFLNLVLPTLIIVIAFTSLTFLKIDSRYKSYWLLLLFVFINELIFTIFIPVGPAKLSANIYSITIAALLLSPIAFITKKWIRVLASNLAALAITVFYATMVLYFLFFDDYPTFNILGYASQGSSITDSIKTLIDERFTSFAFAIVIFPVLINYNEWKQKL